MERLRKHKFPHLVSGHANNVAEFFEKVIQPQFTHKDAIKEFHRTLMEYVKLEGPTLFLRLYGSFPKESYQLLRRGFLTEFPDKTRMVFCDNTFSMIFAGLKIGGYSLSKEQLSDYLRQKELICSFGLTHEEKELSYYTPQNAIRIGFNSKGWYQAHIKPTGYGFGEISIKNLQSFFPNPDRSEWDNTIRKTQTDLSPDQKQLLVAHFIRFIHPLNSFLVPKRDHMKYSGKRIGEEAEVIEFVRNYLKAEFPIEYEEFEKLTVPHSFPEFKSPLADLEWFEDAIPIISEKRKPSKKKKVEPVFEPVHDLNNDPVIKEDEEEKGINLEKWLKSIGKEAYVEILFPALSEDISMTSEEISKRYPKYAEFETQSSRLSTAKSIFKHGLQFEALEIIADSKRLKADLITKARLYLEGKNN
ncbi:MAG TPA: hypothetical protein VFE71_06020 [Bacteroidales bacterium]|nr:hypothetical protein [Bacteroidales bacterium]